MARRPISMRKTKEILRLKHELGLTNRQIAASLNLSHTCVDQHLRQARQAGIGWPLPTDLDDEQLRQRLQAAATTAATGLPDSKAESLASTLATRSSRASFFLRSFAILARCGFRGNVTRRFGNKLPVISE